MAHIRVPALEGCFSSAIGNLMDAFRIADKWHRALCTRDGDHPLFETCMRP